MGDPRKLPDSRDALIAALYAKTAQGDLADLYPILVDTAGNLCVNMTVGTVSLSSTASTITNAVGNPVNVSLSNTKVTIESSSGLNVTLSSTKVTIESAGLNVTPTTTAATITNAVGNPVNVSLTGTVVTVQNVQAGFNVNVATATLGTVTVTGTVTPSTTASTITNAVGNPVNVSLTSSIVTVAPQAGTAFATTGVTVSIGRTITGSTGSVSATWTSIITPTNKAKIFAFSFTTTSATEVTAIICDGVYANSKEKWRVTLMAPTGANSGANLAVSPPGWLFESRTASAVTISLSTAVLVHYSFSFFDEA